MSIVPPNRIKNEVTVKSDTFNNPKNTQLTTSVEGVSGSTSDNVLRVRITKTKLSSQNVNGFKQWLQNNNITVVYMLEEEEVYECTPIHLNSFSNETGLSCNSDFVYPKMEFSINTNINNMVHNNKERIKLLESEIYHSRNLQDMMIIESDIRLLTLEQSIKSMCSTNTQFTLYDNIEHRNISYFDFMSKIIEREVYSKEYIGNVLNIYIYKQVG